LKIIEEELSASLRKVKFVFPFNDQGHVNTVYAKSTVMSVEYTENGTEIVAMADSKICGMLEKYIVE
jgi:50S ribosomal subunit-associated GTPase HflX